MKISSKIFSWSKLTLMLIFLFSCFYTVSSKWKEKKWKEIEGSDGTGYYSYLPATYIYHDYSFHFINPLSKKYPQLRIANNCGFCNLFDGKGVNKYFAGESILLTPFFLTAHLLSGSEKHPADGYSYFYMLAIALAAIFYMLLGLWSIRKLLIEFQVRDGIIAIVLLSLFLGTQLFYYSIWVPEMTHVYSFGLISFFFLLIHRQCQNFNSARNILLAAIFGLIILVRPVNVLVILSLPFLAGNTETLKLFFKNTFSHYFILLFSISIFFSIVSVQLFYYHLQSGHWLVYAYAKEGFDFLHPHFFQSLFSYSNGLFIYAPILFISFLGVFVFLSENRFRFFTFLIFFCCIIWVISSWWAWTYGAAFGMRPLVEYLALFGLLLGLLLNKLSLNRFLVPSLVFFVLFPLTLLCQLQTWQYKNGIIAWDNMTKENYWFVFLETREQFININIPDSSEYLPPSAKLLFQKSLDFESSENNYDKRSVISGKAFSGIHSVCLKESNNHPPYLKVRAGEILLDSILKNDELWISASSEWMLEDNGSEARINIVVKRNDKPVLFEHKYVIHQVRHENKWEKCILNLRLPKMNATDSIFIFPERNIWFPVYIDDLEMKIYAHH
ncbi:hypothetical protein BH09BAC5_BH09BAC5_16370 [soil metagenome]